MRTVGTRSCGTGVACLDGRVRRTVSDGRYALARAASHGWNASVDVLRRTRRNAHTLRGAA
jgi:hypothetical protein